MDSLTKKRPVCTQDKNAHVMFRVRGPLLYLSFKERADWISIRQFHECLFLVTESYIQLGGFKGNMEKLKKIVHRNN